MVRWPDLVVFGFTIYTLPKYAGGEDTQSQVRKRKGHVYILATLIN